MDVFPIPPAPTRATGLKFSARSVIFSINPSRPKQALGGGGGDSPSVLGSSVSYKVSLKPRLLTWIVPGLS